MEQGFASIVNVAAILAGGILLGMLVGYAFARTGQRRQSEGERIRERVEFDNLRGEYDQYRDKVEVHFKETSEVFQKTTEQYRALYQQIATGAVALCDPEAVKPILATATTATNAVEDVASAAMTSFPRKSNGSADDQLGNALAEMRAEMNELDQAIDDLKADVIAPKRDELEKRGLVENNTTPPKPTVDTTTAQSAPADKVANRQPTMRSTGELKVVGQSTTVASNDSVVAAPVDATASATPVTARPEPTATLPARNGAVNDIKNAVRKSKKQLFESGRIISPISGASARDKVKTPAKVVPAPAIAQGQSNKAPVIRLER